MSDLKEQPAAAGTTLSGEALARLFAELGQTKALYYELQIQNERLTVELATLRAMQQQPPAVRDIRTAQARKEG